MRDNLLELIKTPKENRDEIRDVLSKMIGKSIESINANFFKRKLVKLDHDHEPLPKDPRQLSSYRTRLGTIIEYAVGTELDNLFKEKYGNELVLSFSYIHEYPDFYVRNEFKEVVLKIESKLVDCESDEQAARFDAPTVDIDENRDFVLFMVWEWLVRDEQPKGWATPHVFNFVLIPSIEIAKERDFRVTEIGGKIEGRVVLVPSTKTPGTFTKDPGNYGKFWRIVLPNRRNKDNLPEDIKYFLAFQKSVDNKAPRKRMKNYSPKQNKLDRTP